jgi:molecular chaperone DnaK
MGTGKEQKIKITASSGLSKDEVDRMVGEADEHAAEDKKQKELIDIRNKADAAIYSVEKTLKDYGEKISFEDRSEINKKLDMLKEKKNTTDAAGMQQAIDDLQQSVYKLSEAVYRDAAQAQSETPEAAPEAPPESPKQEPQDQKEEAGGSEYRIVDEEEEKEE